VHVLVVDPVPGPGLGWGGGDVQVSLDGGLFTTGAVNWKTIGCPTPIPVCCTSSGAGTTFAYAVAAGVIVVTVACC